MSPKTLPKIPVRDLLRPDFIAALPSCVGREREQQRLGRALQRHDQPNIIITGPAGVGKTTVWHALVRETQSAHSRLPRVPYLQLSTEAVSEWLRDDQTQAEMTQYISRALSSLPPAVVVLDDADNLLRELTESWQLEALVAPFAPGTGRHLIICCRPETHRSLAELSGRAVQSFDRLSLEELTRAECAAVLEAAAPRLSAHYHVTIDRQALQTLIDCASQLSTGQALPRRALTLFDEVCAASVVAEQTTVTPTVVQHVFGQRLGLPSTQLNVGDTQSLQQLPIRLRTQVRGQDHVVNPVATLIQRGWLGLKSPTRPLASCLFFGPSGVGKTELAKALAREVFGDEKALVRLDMSEFNEHHTAARLIGAPPGYVGYEAGGQLTNPVKQRPFSLLLLDEIEKAHSSVFDLFLQVLDDGRLTDSHGETIDFTKTIIIATSNLGLNEIVAAAEQGADLTHHTFIKHYLWAMLTQRFRPEFLNRFELMSVFTPLSLEALFGIAQLELQKIEQRFAHRNVKIEVDSITLRHKIRELYDPRLGARPLKRYLESVAEGTVADQLLTNSHG